MKRTPARRVRFARHNMIFRILRLCISIASYSCNVLDFSQNWEFKCLSTDPRKQNNVSSYGRHPNWLQLLLMAQVEGNNDSNRNNDIILDGRQLLPTQRHFPHLLLHFRVFKLRLLSNKLQITKSSIKSTPYY